MAIDVRRFRGIAIQKACRGDLPLLQGILSVKAIYHQQSAFAPWGVFSFPKLSRPIRVI